MDFREDSERAPADPPQSDDPSRAAPMAVGPKDSGDSVRKVGESLEVAKNAARGALNRRDVVDRAVPAEASEVDPADAGRRALSSIPSWG